MRSIYQGKAESVLPQFPDVCFDALICDPPSSIHFMGREWDSNRGGRTQWVAWLSGILTDAMRTLKPGGHALIWALPRTSHWTMCAIEDAGFEIRDTIHHIFATGMPKGQNISKAIDRLAGAEREVVGEAWAGRGNHRVNRDTYGTYAGSPDDTGLPTTVPATPEAAQWEGWNTTMKPAVEYWILARKPLAESTIAKQVLATGTGALNIDACRTAGIVPQTTQGASSRIYGEGAGFAPNGSQLSHPHEDGRWPANLVLSHSEGCIPLDQAIPAEDRRKIVDDMGMYKTDVYEGGPRRGGAVRGYGDGKDAPAWQCTPECPIALLDAQSGITVSSGGGGYKQSGAATGGVYGTFGAMDYPQNVGKGDTGGASRYFTTLPYDAPFIYLPKSSPADRTMGKLVENGHPTCKSTALMAWLCTLITPPGGTILDCFMGSGSTLVAAERLGFSWVGIDESPEYCAIARARLATLGIDVDVNAQKEVETIVAAQPRIHYYVGSIFEVDAQVLVNPVNCQGVMGKGLAKQFKERYPEMVAAYREDCRTRKLAIGHPRLYKGSTPWILNLPTKDAWTAPSRLSYIEQSLQYIAAHYQQAGITSMAFPKLGCGEGGLSWDEVGPLMAKYLGATSMDVTICVSENDTQYQSEEVS